MLARAFAAATCALPALSPSVLPPAALHPNSLSTSVVTVHGAAARLELRCQSTSLIEALPEGLDADGDGRLAPAELQARSAAIAEYLTAHYVLRAGSGGAPRQGTVLAGRLESLGSDISTEDGTPTEWVNAVFEYASDQLLPDLMLDVTLFIESAPDHRDLCTLNWNDEPPRESLFWMGEFRRYFAPDSPPERRPLTGWIRMGVAHILGGYDHIAFLVALIVAAGSLASLLGVVTAFTLAHSVTLALAALQVVHVNSRWVEMAIALSIAWVGFANLRARRPRGRWKEAFVFGLVHGLGFAGFLSEALYGEPRRLVALVGFNLGVEAGQLVVVIGVVLLLALLRAALRAAARPPVAAPTPDAERWLAPRPVRLGASVVVSLLALYWFAQRAGWV